MERKKNPAAFIRNTCSILDRNDLNHIISWSQDGSGFIIHNLSKFETQILPQYFKHQKYTSFVRQLNMYGFHKQRHPLSQNYFQHQTFQRGQNLAEIKRKPEKKKKYQQQRRMEEMLNIEANAQKGQSVQNQMEQLKIKSEDNLNPQADNSKFQIAEKQEVSEEEISTPNKQIQSLSWLCEQAISQNLILTKIHPYILRAGLNLKNLKLSSLLQNNTDNESTNYIINMKALCELAKNQTMKLYSISDSINS